MESAIPPLGYMLLLKPVNKPEVLMWTFGGMIGYHGMNAGGVAHFANALGGGPANAMGLPHYPIKRMMLECDHVDQVVRLLRTADQTQRNVSLGQARVESAFGARLVGSGIRVVRIEVLADMPAREVAPRARTAAQRELELDARLPEAHVALGLIRFFFEANRPGAWESFRRAVQLGPNSSEAWSQYASYLLLIRLFQQTPSGWGQA